MVETSTAFRLEIFDMGLVDTVVWAPKSHFLKNPQPYLGLGHKVPIFPPLMLKEMAAIGEMRKKWNGANGDGSEDEYETIWVVHYLFYYK